MEYDVQIGDRLILYGDASTIYARNDRATKEYRGLRDVSFEVMEVGNNVEGPWRISLMGTPYENCGWRHERTGPDGRVYYSYAIFPKWTPLVEKKKSGAVCVNCREVAPFAEHSETFICYRCRSNPVMMVIVEGKLRKLAGG